LKTKLKGLSSKHPLLERLFVLSGGILEIPDNSVQNYVYLEQFHKNFASIDLIDK
jgi:hypothetical protein